MASKISSKGIKPEEVADFFLAFANEKGELLTNLKLQKLVYYAQAWHLALKGEALFDADFEAWVHGPVVPDLYFKFKKYGFTPIKSSSTMEKVSKSFDEDTMAFLQEVAKIYVRYGAYDLELMTHKEEPWIKARNGKPLTAKCTDVISKSSMKDFYGKK